MDPEDVRFHAPDTTVCADHLNDDGLQQFVSHDADYAECDYCDRSESEPFAVSLYDLIEFVAEGLQSEFNNADDEGVPWETAEGGYQLVTPRSSYELIDDLGLVENEELLTHLAGGMRVDNWVQRDFIRLSAADRLTFGYDTFADEVKHRQRYFFRKPVDETDEEDSDYVSPTDLLTTIGRTAEALGLPQVLGRGTPIYRARTHHGKEQPASASELGAPPTRYALAANRMSPAGVSMFYGALAPETARAEAKAASPDPDPPTTVAHFVSLRPLRLLDLSEPPSVPSLFDSERRSHRAEIAFLGHFVRELRRPVTRDKSEHVEYVPTQVVCEFLRSQFTLADGSRLDGIAYASAQVAGGISVVLFLDQDGAKDPNGSRAADQRRAAESPVSLRMWERKAALELADWERTDEPPQGPRHLPKRLLGGLESAARSGLARSGLPCLLRGWGQADSSG